MSVEFRAYGKTPRLFRDIQITEKIDGTNAAVVIENRPMLFESENPGAIRVRVGRHAEPFVLWAQSRKRIITPDDDNFGFAAWAHENAVNLVKALGVGTHFGEWYGQGINRRYGLDHKRFALFNPSAYLERVWLPQVPNLETVPVLYEGPFGEAAVRGALDGLSERGSAAVPGFARPEGVIVWHTASRDVFKVLIENDGQPKGAAA